MLTNKLKWFYRISIWLFLTLISCSVLVKTIIWYPSSLRPDREKKVVYPIGIFKGTPRARNKYTTQLKRKLFNTADNLLTPAFILLFASIAVRLIKTPQIFEDKKWQKYQ